MRLRSAVPLALLAVSLVAWLSTRMWFGTDPRVWMISCILGAWAPIGAAALARYVRAIAHREDSVLIAWLVRALGMHCVLVWMLGFSDFMRGPPGQIPHWNQDAGAPVALLSFVPVFALSYAAIGWLLAISRRLVRPAMRPAMPGERNARVMPFRGLFLVSAGAPQTRVPVTTFIVGAAAITATITNVSLPAWLLPSLALPLAFATIRNHRALVPSVATVFALALALLVRGGSHSLSAVALGVRWPWLALLGMAVYLATVEGLLRVRPALAR